MGAELERDFCELAGRRIRAAEHGSVLREVTERHRDASAMGRRDRSSPRLVQSTKRAMVEARAAPEQAEVVRRVLEGVGERLCE